MSVEKQNALAEPPLEAERPRPLASWAAAARRVNEIEAVEPPPSEPEVTWPPHDVAEDMRAAAERDDALRDAIYADAMTAVARLRVRAHLDPSVWTPAAARTVLGVVRLLMDDQDRARG